MTASKLGEYVGVSESTVVCFPPLRWDIPAIPNCKRRFRN